MFTKSTSRLAYFAVVVASAFASGHAFATDTFDIEVVNPGFEDDVLGYNEFIYGAHGWTAVDAGVWHPSIVGFPDGAPEGQNVGYTIEGGSLSQVLGTEVSANTDYFVELEIGHVNTFDFSSYSVELWAGDTQLIGEGEENIVTPGPGNFATLAMTYVVPVDEPVDGFLEIRLVDTSMTSSRATFDNVRVSGMAVPGPAALAFLGMAGLVGGRRRRA